MSGKGMIIAYVYQAATAATLIYLTFFDRMPHGWLRWVIAAFVNVILAGIWPIYWAILRPLFGQ